MVSTNQGQSKGIDTPPTSNIALQDNLGIQPHVYVQHPPVVDTQVSGASGLMPNLLNPRLVSFSNEAPVTQIVTTPYRPMYTTTANPSFPTVISSTSYQIPFPSTAYPQVFHQMHAPQHFTHFNPNIYDSHFHGNPVVWNTQGFMQPMHMPHPSTPFPVVPIHTPSSPLQCTVSSVEHAEVKVKHKMIANHEETLRSKYIEMKYPTLIQGSTVNKYFDLFMVDTKERSHVNIEDIGKLPDGSQAQCILSEGESGMGKTMLLHHLAKQWATRKMFTRTDWYSSIL